MLDISIWNARVNGLAEQHKHRKFEKELPQSRITVIPDQGAPCGPFFRFIDLRVHEPGRSTKPSRASFKEKGSLAGNIFTLRHHERYIFLHEILNFQRLVIWKSISFFVQCSTQNEDGLPRFAQNDAFADAPLKEVFDAAIHALSHSINTKNENGLPRFARNDSLGNASSR